MIPCSGDGYQHFEWIFSLHLQDRFPVQCSYYSSPSPDLRNDLRGNLPIGPITLQNSILKKEAACSSETVSSYNSTGWHIQYHHTIWTWRRVYVALCFTESDVSTVSTNGLKIAWLLWMAELVIHSIKHAWRPDVVNRPEWGSYFFVPPLPRWTKWFHFPTRPAGRLARWVMGTRRQLSLKRAASSFKSTNRSAGSFRSRANVYICIYISHCVSVGEWVCECLIACRTDKVKKHRIHLPPRLKKGVEEKTATIHTTTMLLRKGICNIRLAENNVTTKQNTTLSWEYIDIRKGRKVWKEGQY